MESSDYIQMFIAIVAQMYAILNPPSGIAIMLGMSKHSSVEERLAASKQICIIGSFLLFTFAIFGPIILDDIFHISTEAFKVGGGLYLFSIGLSMLLAQDPENSAEHSETKTKLSSLVITPLATPLLVGPGTITATLVKRMELPDSTGCAIAFYLALALTMVFVYVSFVLGCKFSKYLTPSILKIVEKLVGVLLACIAISSILSGMRTFLQTL